MARRGYSDEVKAACLAALAGGRSVAEIAQSYNVPPATVRSWKSRLAGGGRMSSFTDDQRKRIGELVIEYLVAGLITLRKQLGVFEDAEWLKKQSAGELAILHGVGFDKALLVLEALERSNADDEADDGAKPVP